MEYMNYQHLTELEKRIVGIVFKGWKQSYLEKLKFKRVADGWLVHDADLKVTQYMHTKYAQ